MYKLNHKAFTLLELIAVILILSILLMIAVPLISKFVEKAKRKAFFTSITNIVNSVEDQTTFEENNKCVYYYEFDKENLPSNVNELYIIVRPDENDKPIYAVYAEISKDVRTIDTINFKKLSINDTDEVWAPDVFKEDEDGNIISNDKIKDTASYFVSELVTDFDVNENYVYCPKVAGEE